MKKLISIIIITIAVTICFAQEYALEELIEIGLEKSYDIQEAKSNLKDNQSYLRSSYYGLLPSLNLNYGNSYYFDAADPEWNDAASLSASKTFFLNDPTFFNIYTSIENMKIADLSFNESKKQIAYYIFSSYLGVLEAQETLEIQEKNLQLQNKIHQQIQVQYDAGDKSLLELKQSEVSLIDYEIAVNEANNTLSKARKDLFSYLNIDDAGYGLVSPEIEIKNKEMEFTKNNILMQQEKSININKANSFKSMLNFFPSISIGYSFGHDDPNDVYDFSSYSRTDNSLYLSATWNIFGLLDKYESYKIQKRYNKLLTLNYQTTRDNYTIQSENLQNDFSTLQKSYDLYEEKLALAEENLNMAQEQFKLGMISLLELDDKKLEYQNTQLAKIQKYYQLLKKQEEINLLNSDLILGKW
ncbi:MAG: TolC family protein [Candidatus Cloacimonetes bacterium]|nr:TolC family protein [Candidatus Cloacimonadota bacterium]MCF7814007.1 TolC family protein [Candidatus Cloacimonadota bacterium]MCF7867943.1 TolC family protein [Candidatus Cloacimonadota bacterium]MCF7882864.1 TolC family protein [Candidatus Cloacimonadota bacterium]